MQDDRGARETRDWFRKVLEQYPPSVRDVLRIDTSLLSRPDYLATYPALAAFLMNGGRPAAMQNVISEAGAIVYESFTGTTLPPVASNRDRARPTAAQAVRSTVRP